jgi:pimeloyl-ACP methyl ester carboxylesterase
MKRYLFALLAILEFMSNLARCQDKDAFVDVGGDRLHFHIMQGRGVPTLFEAGGGDDATVWNDVLKPIADITGTTLIAYDRAGFGKSELNTAEQNIDKHGIRNGLEGLETALTKLGYTGNIMLVAHSYGGFCRPLGD